MARVASPYERRVAQPTHQSRATNVMTLPTTSEYEILKAVGHPLRRQILMILAVREASAKELAQELNIALPNVSYHVAILRDLGLLDLVRETPKRGATERHYRASPRTPQQAWEVVASGTPGPLSEPARIDGRTVVLDGRARRELDAATRQFLIEIDSIANASASRTTKRSKISRTTVAVVASSRATPPPGSPKPRSAAGNS